MQPYDHKAQLQLAAERQADLARDYERARKAQAAPRAARRRRQPALAPLLRALRRA